MATGSIRRILPVAAVFLAAAAGPLVAGGPAWASSCPTVNLNTGAVTPAPAPGVDWSGCDLADADIPGSDLSGANLAGASLTRANLGWSDLSAVSFKNANLRAAFLRGADMESADFTGANLSYVLMDGADIAGTVLAGAKLHAVWSGRDTGIPASLPPHWLALRGYLIGPSADLSGAGLKGADLSGLDLAGTSFTGADLRDADLRGADLFGANVTGVNWTHAQCPGHTWYSNGRCVLAFRVGRFFTPKPGAAVRASAHALVVHFSLLATALGSVRRVASRIAASLARSRRVRVVLSGKRIRRATGYCTWKSRHQVYQCDIRIPRRVVVGRGHRYLLTVQERPQGRFVRAGWAYRSDLNPETIYFTSAHRR